MEEKLEGSREIGEKLEGSREIEICYLGARSRLKCVLWEQGASKVAAVVQGAIGSAIIKLLFDGQKVSRLQRILCLHRSSNLSIFIH